MDNYMEKITHKFSSSDMIKANLQADADMIDSQREQLQLFTEQMGRVDTAISEVREVNLKNIESASEVSNLARESVHKVGEAVKNVEAESVNRIRETADKSKADMNSAVEQTTTAINKAVNEGLAKIAEVQNGNGAIEGMSEKVSALSTELEDIKEFIHAEDVKIYRNVQASFVEELSKQIDDVKNQIKKVNSQKGLIIFGLILVGIDLFINIIKLLGLI